MHLSSLLLNFLISSLAYSWHRSVQSVQASSFIQKTTITGFISKSKRNFEKKTMSRLRQGTGKNNAWVENIDLYLPSVPSIIQPTFLALISSQTEGMSRGTRLETVLWIFCNKVIYSYYRPFIFQKNEF